MQQMMAARAFMAPALAHRRDAAKLPRARPSCDAAAMSRDTVNAICAALPGAEVSDPWGGGHDCWKVGGKMFAVIGAVTPTVSVKTDGVETVEMLVEAGVAQRAPYFHRSWIAIPLAAAEDELSHRIRSSYRLIRAALPRKVQATLRPLAEEPR